MQAINQDTLDKLVFFLPPHESISIPSVLYWLEREMTVIRSCIYNILS